MPKSGCPQLPWTVPSNASRNFDAAARPAASEFLRPFIFDPSTSTDGSKQFKPAAPKRTSQPVPSNMSKRRETLVFSPAPTRRRPGRPALVDRPRQPSHDQAPILEREPASSDRRQQAQATPPSLPGQAAVGVMARLHVLVNTTMRHEATCPPTSGCVRWRFRAFSPDDRTKEPSRILIFQSVNDATPERKSANADARPSELRAAEERRASRGVGKTTRASVV